jgi:hypothetical protein
MSGAESQNVCPVTKAPEHPFIPPPPLDKVEDGTFVLGTSGLWARVTTHWLLNRTGNKLPYHSEIYAQDVPHYPQSFDRNFRALRLALVARRLDGPEPLVWSGRVAVGLLGGVMITGLAIPTAGCWEISAHYIPERGKVQTLTYTAWVEDVGILPDNP